jgi:RHS repeat-associated protein
VDPVATQTDAGALTFLVTDPHNTATMSVSDTNTVTSSRRFDPFGNTRDASSGVWPDARGFLNAPADTTTGLTHLGAREYDPTIGRFISVDPELDLSDPTQWNAYGYANGNPTTLSDPSGRRPEGSGDYGCSNCMMSADGSWKFGNETAGSQSVHGGTYHQSYAAAQEQHTTKAHNDQRQHNSNAGDNVLAREAQRAQLARERRAATIAQLTAAAHASSTGGHWYNPMDWDGQTWTQIGLGAATVGLTVINVVQLGADPVTDGLEGAVIAEMVGEGAVEVAAETTTEVAADTAESGAARAAINGETTATRLGRQMHASWDYGEGFEKEFRLPSGKRVDALNFQTRQAVELKPNNPRAIRLGERQVGRYVEELNQAYPDDVPWTGSVVTYGGS